MLTNEQSTEEELTECAFTLIEVEVWIIKFL